MSFNATPGGLAAMSVGGLRYAALVAGNNNVKAGPGTLVGVIITSGTGSVAAHDNAAGDTSGTLLHSLTTTTTGQVVNLLGIACTAGISVTLGATTTGIALYA